MKTRLIVKGSLRAIDAETMRVQAVISTGDIARDDAIIDPAGWDFTNYRRNPVVLFNHNDFSGLPVARTVEGPAPVGTELVATAEFDREDPDAVRLFGKISRGYINATSVRWLPKRWEFVKMPGGDGGERTVLVFREQELLEWSFVNIPSDPGAVILRADGEPIDLSAFAGLSLQDIANAEIVDDTGEEDEEESETQEDERHHASLLAVVSRLEAVVNTRAQRPTVDDLIVRALAKKTGRTEERIRQEINQ